MAAIGRSGVISGRLFGSAVKGAQQGDPSAPSRKARGRGSQRSVVVGGGGGASGRGGGGNNRASAFARAFGIEESSYEPNTGPVRRERGRRAAGPYETSEDVDADYNGFPRYQQYDWDEPNWEHDQFEGPMTVGSAIFVRNLPPGVEGWQLKPLFEEAGQIASIQVDNGPIPTATIAFVRQGVASDAAELFQGRWLRGNELKITVKAAESSGARTSDEDFWRTELREMRQSGRLIGNDPRSLAAYGAWEDDWRSREERRGFGSERKAKGKGKSKNFDGSNPEGDPGPGRGGMRSALSWDN